MNNNFNMVKDKWIPFVTDSGTGLFSLEDVFSHGEELRSFNLKPEEVLPLMLFLLPIVHRSLFLYDKDALRDENSWLKCKDSMRKSVIKYIRENENLFNLYGEHAFMQVSHMRLKSEKDGATPLRKMFLKLSSGNCINTHQDQSVFNCEENDVFTDNEIALNFVEYLNVNNIGVGLLTQSGIIDGYEYPNTRNGIFPFYQSRWNRFIYGKNIIDTLWYNIVTFEMFSKHSEYKDMMDNPYGVPYWEYDLNDIFENNRKIPTKQMVSLIGRMMPLNLMFKILDNRSFIMNNGLDYKIKNTKNKKNKNIPLTMKYLDFNGVNAVYDNEHLLKYRGTCDFEINVNESYTYGAFRSLGTCLDSSTNDFWCKKHLFTLEENSIFEDVISSCISIGHKKSIPVNAFEWTTPLNTLLMTDTNLAKFENLMKIASSVMEGDGSKGCINGEGVLMSSIKDLIVGDNKVGKKMRDSVKNKFIRSFWNILFDENIRSKNKRSLLSIEDILETYGNDERGWIDLCIETVKKAYVVALNGLNIDTVEYYRNYDRLYFCGNFNKNY